MSPLLQALFSSGLMGQSGMGPSGGFSRGGRPIPMGRPSPTVQTSGNRSVMSMNPVRFGPPAQQPTAPAPPPYQMSGNGMGQQFPQQPMPAPQYAPPQSQGNAGQTGMKNRYGSAAFTGGGHRVGGGYRPRSY